MRVLLLRTNAYGELFHTRDAVDLVRDRLRAAEVVALTTPRGEGRSLVEADTRLDGVLQFPARAGGVRSLLAFRAFVRERKIDGAVACVGATPGMDYTRPLLSLLLCPGRKYILDRMQALYPLCSRRGGAVMGRALLSVARLRAVRLLARGVGRVRRTPARRARGGASGLDLTREQVKRILWIRVDGIGDVVMTLPALDALRAQFPRAQIDLLVRPLSAPLVQELPGVGDVYTYEPEDAPASTRSQERHGLLALTRRLRANRYDLAVDVAGRDVARALAWCSGARVRVAPEMSRYDDPARGNLSFLMTHPVPLSGGAARSAADTFLGLMAGVGVTVPDAPYRWDVGRERIARVREKLTARGVGGRCAVLHPKSSEEMRDWRPERFAQVADHLAGTYGLQVLLSGGLRDKSYCAAIRAASRAPEHLVDVCGMVALSELPALLALARLMVTVDTGPMHVAALVGTPVICLTLPCYHYNRPYGQADGVVRPPKSEADRNAPFAGFSAEHFWSGGLLDGISVSDVLAAVDRKMRASEAAPRRAA